MKGSPSVRIAGILITVVLLFATGVNPRIINFKKKIFTLRDEEVGFLGKISLNRKSYVSFAVGRATPDKYLKESLKVKLLLLTRDGVEKLKREKNCHKQEEFALEFSNIEIHATTLKWQYNLLLNLVLPGG